MEGCAFWHFVQESVFVTGRFGEELVSSDVQE